MISRPLAIHAIKQLDNHTFQIDWIDGTVSQYRLSELQKNCPCASCVDETTGRRIKPAQSINENVQADNIQSVGRYALKIRYTSGCSTGIYSLEMLRAFCTIPASS